MINLAIIDSDSICYMGSKEDSLQQILEKVDNKIQEILTETDAHYYVLLVSKGKYFRHEISKNKEVPEGTYKANRIYGEQIWVKTIKEYLIAKYKALSYSMLEADDICSWLMNKTLYWAKFINPHSNSFWMLTDKKENADEYEEINKILVAKDKDLLYSIPGRHLNFSKKLGPDTWGMEWVETTEESAERFKCIQLCMGDNSDGISALRGVGIKTAEKWLQYTDFTNSDEIKSCYSSILNKYQNQFGISQGIYEFSLNYRLLHMLSSDEDMLREVGYTPSLPEFQKVIKQEEVKVNEIEF